MIEGASEFHLTTGLSWSYWVCVLYLVTHSALILKQLAAGRGGAWTLPINVGLMALFLAVLGNLPWLFGSPFKGLLLWAPIIFFWWAYRWAGQTLTALYAADSSLDPTLLQLEALYGQPSLHWARRGNRVLTEVLHIFYFSYYFYTLIVGATLHLQGRLLQFQAMSLAVVLGYAIAYTCFALTPVWGPRWALEEQGLISKMEQRLQGFALTAFLNRIMYQGIALRGGAMPSAHSSTAVVFLVWCWRIWEFPGGIVAFVVVVGMWVGSVYGRYHYVVDVVAGAIIGSLGILIADALILAK